MMRATYEAKLATTVITDENTVGEAKAAQRVKKSLERFWKKAAIAYIQRTEGRDLEAERINWTSLRYDFNLKTTGTVTIEVWANDDRSPSVFSERFKVPKKELLS